MLPLHKTCIKIMSNYRESLGDNHENVSFCTDRNITSPNVQGITCKSPKRPHEIFLKLDILFIYTKRALMQKKLP